MPKLRTVVTFQSDSFNTTVVRPYFISVNSFGDDVAQHVVYELRKLGFKTGEPAQEDVGWYFTFEYSGKAHLFIIGYRPVEQDWLGAIERVPWLFLKREVDPDAARAIQLALSDSQIFRNVRWHVASDFDAGDEQHGSPEP